MRRLETKRQMATEDIADVQRLLDAAAATDRQSPLSDHLYLDLISGGASGFAGIVAYDDGPDHPVAYAQVSSANDSHSVEIVVDPAQRHELDTIGPELIDAVLGAVASDGGGQLNWWVFEPTTADHDLAERSGMTIGRTLLQMQRPLPTGLDVAVETRAFDPSLDEEHWLQVNNRAFADHGEQGGWTLDTLRQREQETWFDPEGFRIHERDGRLAAFCWTKVHPPDDPDDPGSGPVGEIYVIAVDPDFHGLGLGKQLTLAGLEHLADCGISTAMLYVDGDNSAAVGLYERLGFTVTATKVAFLADVAPAPHPRSEPA